MEMKNILLITILSLFMLFSCGSKEKNDSPTPGVETGADVTLFVTTTTLSKDLTREGLSFSKSSSTSSNIIALEPSIRYQEMDGFGAAVTGSTCFNLMQMTQENRTAFLTETFSQDKGFGFSYIRISIGCSDFSLSEYTCCDKKGIENFALQDEETGYVIPIIKEILAINPNIKILGSPWTCPKWMKVRALDNKVSYDSWTGGQLNPYYYQDYATYFVKWITAFESNGIHIYAITPQNEPLNRGNSASLYMGWEEQRDFVKTALGSALENAGLSTKIYAFDHNYNYDNISTQQGYPLKIYEDASAEKYFAGAAYHNYGGDKGELINIHSANPKKELIFTETSIGTWNSGRNLSKRLLDDMEQVALGTVNNWCKGVIVWNLMLDNNRGPNREGGCQSCYGAVDISSSDFKTITRNSHYYIIAHLSSVVKPGAVRIGSKGGSIYGVTYSAFENPDGTYALVLSNSTTEVQNITVSDGVHRFSYAVPSKAVVSFKWSK